MSKNMSCESCPYAGIPLSDTEGWDLVAIAQRESSPDLSDETNTYITDLGRQIRAGLEENMIACPGFSFWKALGYSAVEAIGASGLIFGPRNGDRLVRWAERSCNNPYLLSDEHDQLAQELAGELTPGSDEVTVPLKPQTLTVLD